MKPVPLTACTVLALLWLYVGAYFGTNSSCVFNGAFVRDFDPEVPIEVFRPLAHTKASLRGRDVYLVTTVDDEVRRVHAEPRLVTP